MALSSLSTSRGSQVYDGTHGVKAFSLAAVRGEAPLVAKRRETDCIKVYEKMTSTSLLYTLGTCAHCLNL